MFSVFFLVRPLLRTVEAARESPILSAVVVVITGSVVASPFVAVGIFVGPWPAVLAACFVALLAVGIGFAIWRRMKEQMPLLDMLLNPPTDLPQANANDPLAINFQSLAALFETEIEGNERIPARVTQIDEDPVEETVDAAGTSIDYGLIPIAVAMGAERTVEVIDTAPPTDSSDDSEQSDAVDTQLAIFVQALADAIQPGDGEETNATDTRLAVFMRDAELQLAAADDRQVLALVENLFW
ncbi:MAG: hypothetical protein LBC42_02060, partial [Puniceicoccales bacterium]|nr:hypothetical protein [Puniceicoccales bacterium]